jgi:hypothetical protein
LSDEPGASLELIARQQKQLMIEMGSLRDDMRVLTAIVMRQDTTLAAMLEEIRAMHAQHARLGARVRDLEERQ